MFWLAIKQSRTSLLLVAGTLFAVLVGALLTTPMMNVVWAESGMAGCTVGCEVAAANLFELTSGSLVEYFTIVPTLLMPFAIIAFPFVFGAQAVGKDLEDGVQRLAWLQSTTRSKWLAAKIAVALGVAIISIASLQLIWLFWGRRLVAAGAFLGHALPFGQFAFGINSMINTVFGIALAILLSLMFRSVVGAGLAAVVGLGIVPELVHRSLAWLLAGSAATAATTWVANGFILLLAAIAIALAFRKIQRID